MAFSYENGIQLCPNTTWGLEFSTISRRLPGAFVQNITFWTPELSLGYPAEILAVFSHFGPKGLQPKGWFGRSSRVVAVQPCDPRHRDTAPRHARHSALASDSDAEIARFAACASRSASVSVTCIPFAFRIYFAPFLVASTKSFTLLQTSWNDFHISTTNKCGRKDIFATFIF